MTSAQPSSRRRLVGFAFGLVLLIVVAAAVALTRDSDGLGKVRSQSAVESAERYTAGDTVELRFRPTAGRAGVIEALDALPDDADDVTLLLGRAELELGSRRGGRSREELVDVLVAAAAVRASAESIEVSPISGIEATVRERAEAVPVALEISDRVARGGIVPAVNVLRVEVVGPDRALTSPVSMELTGMDGDPSAGRAALRASERLAARQPRVSGRGKRLELRLRATSLEDAARAWREARAALVESGAPLADTSVYVDLPSEEGSVRPVLGGQAEVDPDRALGLLRAFDRREATRLYAAVDLSYARARANDAEIASRVTADAARADVDRFDVSWRTIYGEQAWMAGAVGEDRMLTTLNDDPDVVRRMLPGVAAARAAGLPAVHWDRERADGQPRLRFARPSWIATGTKLSNEPKTLERLARAVRKIDWPGVATFALILGPGDCAGSKSAAVVTLTSTSTGRARSVEDGGACTGDDAADAGRAAWSATADR